MANLAIIGAGNIGSRHLQALAKTDFICNIYIVDKSDDALALSEQRFNEVEPAPGHNLVKLRGIEELPSTLDLAIVATSSGVRKAVVEELLEHVKVPYLIMEKFLFPRVEDYYVINSLLHGKGIKAWVNTGRRTESSYQSLAAELAAAKRVDMTVAGSKWGLGCNGIHELDLYDMLCGGGQYRVISEDLDPAIYKSKRSGYIEFNGTLIIKGPKGILNLTCLADGDMPSVVTITTDIGIYQIFEHAQACEKLISQNNYIKQTVDFSLRPTSRTTTGVAEEIIHQGRCSLTPYESSMKLHLVLLEVFIQKKNSIDKKGDPELCPIT